MSISEHPPPVQAAAQSTGRAPALIPAETLTLADIDASVGKSPGERWGPIANFYASDEEFLAALAERRLSADA